MVSRDRTGWQPTAGPATWPAGQGGQAGGCPGGGTRSRTGWPDELWSPTQISQLRMVPARSMMAVSPRRSIVTCTCRAGGRCARNSADCLRTGRGLRRNRSRIDQHRGIYDKIMISQRPREVADGPARPMEAMDPGAKGNPRRWDPGASGHQVLMLSPARRPHAQRPSTAITSQAQDSADHLMRSSPGPGQRDEPQKRRLHQRHGGRHLLLRPHSPWQRGSREPPNGLLANEPKAPDVSVHFPAESGPNHRYN